MKTSDRWDVIQGDEGCRDGHYRAKQDLRLKTVASAGADLLMEPDPNDSTSRQAQNPTDLGDAEDRSCFGRGSRHSCHLEYHALRNW